MMKISYVDDKFQVLLQTVKDCGDYLAYASKCDYPKLIRSKHSPSVQLITPSSSLFIVRSLSCRL